MRTLAALIGSATLGVLNRVHPADPAIAWLGATHPVWCGTCNLLHK